MAMPTSSGLASLLTLMPPIGVLMSTCLPWPLFSFLTFTLHDESSIASVRNTIPIGQYLVLPMACPSPGDLRGTFQPSATLRDVRNRDRKTTANRNFSEKCFDRCDLGDRRVGKSAHVVL